MSIETIQAKFKAASIKDGGTATLQFDVSTSADGFLSIIEKTGDLVDLTVEPRQKELEYSYEAEEVESVTSEPTEYSGEVWALPGGTDD